MANGSSRPTAASLNSAAARAGEKDGNAVNQTPMHVQRNGAHPHAVFTRQQVQSGEERLVPGDFIVTHGSGFVDSLIRLMTRSRWNHAALIVASDGTLIEALGTGLTRDKISKYQRRDYFVVRLDLDDEDRAEVLAYANAMLERHPKYGLLTIATIALRILTRMRLVIKKDGTFICSEFVARSLAQGGRIWFEDTSLITPADLYNSCVKNEPI